MLALIPVIIQLLEAGITIVPQLIDAAKTEIALVNGQTAPSAEQQAQIDAALETANNALQAAQPSA